MRLPCRRRRCANSSNASDGPALRDTILWFALIIGSGWAGYALWQAGSWWAVVPFAIYGMLYGSTSDSRWHESGHGTAFKTDWMNNVLYEIASFMVMREATPWRWSHTRHHSDTIIVGRDPEIAVPRPPSMVALILNFFGLKGHSALLLARLAPQRRAGSRRRKRPTSRNPSMRRCSCGRASTC